MIRPAEYGILIQEWRFSVLMGTRMIYFHALLTTVETQLLQDLKITLVEFGEILTTERMSRIVL